MRRKPPEPNCKIYLKLWEKHLRARTREKRAYYKRRIGEHMKGCNVCLRN